jgi:beta-mannosidase
MLNDRRGCSTLPVQTRAPSTFIIRTCTILFAFSGIQPAEATHHMAVRPPQRVQPRKEPVTPLLITNYCPETIWPAISTQSGEGPGENGFELRTGTTYNQTVSED